MHFKRKYLISLSSIVIMTTLSAIFFIRLNSSRREILVENAKEEFLLVTELTAESISYGYFQWDDMFLAVKENQLLEVEEYFEEIYELSSFVSEIYIVQQPFDYPEHFFRISGTEGDFFCDFRIYDGSSETFLNGMFARAVLDPEAILTRIQPRGPLILSDDDRGYHIGFGLKLDSTEPPIYFFQLVSTLMIGLFFMILINRIMSRSRHFFYETRGLEKVIFLFERTEKYSADHSRRVAIIAGLLGKKLKFRKKRLKDLRVASLLHDIGKISVPIEVLNKRDKLKRDEYDTIKEHVNYSSQIIENFEELTHLRKIIHCHHEKMDGSGYPNGLKGHEIPLESRIISVADVFEALIGKRPYRDPIEPAEAVRKMNHMALDTRLVLLLEENLDEVMDKLKAL